MSTLKPPRKLVKNRPIDRGSGEEKMPDTVKKRRFALSRSKGRSLAELEARQIFKTDIDFTPELYHEILEKWIKNNESIANERFSIRDGIWITGNTNIKNMYEFENTGTKSNVYVLTINDDRQFIIKQNLPGNSIRAEAELQKYAATVYGLAPDVFAYNETTILMEKGEIIPRFKTNYMNGLHIGIHRTESNSTHRLIQELMQKERLTNLDVSIDLYGKTGMFIMDTHDNNYVLKKNKVVPIDFDDVRFKNQEIYQLWRESYFKVFGAYPLNESCRVLETSPEDPPYYYWWRNRADVYKGLDKLESVREFTWDRQAWVSERRKYEITLQVIIADNKRNVEIQQAIRRQNIVRRASTAGGEESKEKYIPVFRFFVLRI